MRFFNRNELFLLEEEVKRNFSAKYKDSVLGIFWTVLKPLMIMVLLTIIFSTMFSRSIGNYPVYLLCGRCIYDWFTSSVSVSINAIKSNKSILQRTAAPKHIFILGGIISEFLNFLITLIILFGVMIVTNAPFNLFVMPLSIIPVISLILMVTGLGFMLSIMSVYFTDIKHLWGIVSMMLMYASAIFYPMDMIPEPYHGILILNPVFWIINQFRSFIYLGTIPSALYILNSLLLSSIILVLGLIIFKKYEKKVIMKL